MANYVEKATLKLVDETSANAKKISASLKSLFGIARLLKIATVAPLPSSVVASYAAASAAAKKYGRDAAAANRTANVAAKKAAISKSFIGPLQPSKQIRSSAMNPAASAARDYAKAAAAAKSYSQAASAARKIGSFSPHVDVTAIANLRSLTRALQAYTAAAHAVPRGLRPISPRVAPSPVPGAPALPAARPRGGRRAGANGNPAIAGARGLSQGIGIAGLSTSLASFDAGLVAVTAAAYLAGKALKSVADNAASRDRTQLQLNAVSSKEQRAIIEQNNKTPAGAGPITFTKDERSKLITSLLGDVQGNDKQRAQGAVNIAKYLETELLPRQFAATPDKSRAENLVGLRELVKAVNLASSELTDAAGNITEDGKRAFRAIQLAKAADPELDPKLIKSTVANLKTTAFQLDEKSLAMVLANAGNAGVRVANEAFRSQKSLSGTTDNKVLNNALSDAGLLKGAKRNDRNNVIAGTGKPVDEALLGIDPSAWLQKNIAPIVEKLAKKNADAEGRAVTQNDRVQATARALPGLSAAALNGITQMLLAVEQNASMINQAMTSLNQPVGDILKESWTAQAEAVGVAWKNAASSVGDKFANAIQLDKLLGGLASVLNGERELTPKEVTAGLGGAAILGTAGVGLGKIVVGALNPLNGSALALTTSAGLLDAAALALSASAGGGVVGKVAGAAAAAAPAAAVAGGLTVGGIVAAGAAILAVGAGIGALSHEARKFNESIKDTPRYEAHNRGNKAARAARQALVDGRAEEVARNQPRDDAARVAEIGRILFEQFMVKANAESVINKAKEKLKENEAKEQTPQVQAENNQLKSTINALTVRIAEMQKAVTEVQAEKKALTPAPDADVFQKGADPVAGLESAMKIGTIIDASLVKGGETTKAGLDAGFMAGAIRITEAGNGMGNAILGLAPSIGNAIGSAAGSAITAAVQGISVNIKNNGSGANTGKSNPVE